MRLFIALRPPAEVRAMLLDTMEGLDAVRWQDEDQLHVTLRFLGDVERPQADDVAAALGSIRSPAIAVRIDGVGRFSDTLWAGLAPHDALAALHRKVDNACIRAALPPERRAYLPHVTLARFPRSAGRDTGIAHWLAAHAGLVSPEFLLDHVVLYESTLGRAGAHYDALARWPLGTGQSIVG